MQRGWEVCWRWAEGGVFRINKPLIAFTSLLPTWVNSALAVERTPSLQQRRAHLSQRGDQDPGGKGEGEGVGPMSESEWKIINILAGTSQTSASLFVGGTQWSKTGSLQHACQGLLLSLSWTLRGIRVPALSGQWIPTPIPQGQEIKYLGWTSQLPLPLSLVHLAPCPLAV